MQEFLTHSPFGDSGGSGSGGGMGGPPGSKPSILTGGVVQTVKPPNSVPSGTPLPGGPQTIGLSPGSGAPGSGGSGGGGGEVKQKITHTGTLGQVRHQDNWKRKTNLSGEGATHVRTFHCRLNSESTALLDQQINQWLDEHTDYEVKQVQTCVGEWQGKVKEPYLIVTVWV